jgi:DNA (cytosine-5)-methyltransferase 1
VMEPMLSQTSQQEKALVVPLRTNHEARHPMGRSLDTLVAGTTGAGIATTGFALPTAGNTYERPGQVRSRHLTGPLFTQHATMAFGFAHTPFVAELRGGGSNERSVLEPAAAVTGGGFHHGLTSPALFQKINGGPGDTAWHHLGDSLNTITGRDTTGMIVLPWVEQYQSDPIAVTEQMATIMSHARHALATAQPLALDKVTDADLEQVRFRMLEPHPELRRAMAFGDEYILLGNKSQMTSGLGNAVTPPVASWITKQCLSTLDQPLAA